MRFHRFTHPISAWSVSCRHKNPDSIESNPVGYKNLVRQKTGLKGGKPTKLEPENGFRNDHLHELFLSVLSLDLHGVIDLLFQDRDDEWHLAEWKTDWVDEKSLDDKVMEYRQQIAIYISAVQSILSFTPEAHLYFLTLNNGTCSFDHSELVEFFHTLNTKNS